MHLSQNVQSQKGADVMTSPRRYFTWQALDTCVRHAPKSVSIGKRPRPLLPSIRDTPANRKPPHQSPLRLLRHAHVRWRHQRHRILLLREEFLRQSSVKTGSSRSGVVLQGSGQVPLFCSATRKGSWHREFILRGMRNRHRTPPGVEVRS